LKKLSQGSVCIIVGGIVDEKEGGDEGKEIEERREEGEEIKHYTRAQFDILVSARFVPLTDDEDEIVDAALAPPSSESVLFSKFDTPITRRIIHCLRPSIWLNDEVEVY
jgi:Ulp1 family protease